VSDLADSSELRVNVFYLDHCPRAAAEAHCDRHVVKMILESAQLLSTAWHVVAPNAVEQSIGSTDPAYPLIDRTPAIAARLEFGTVYYLGNQRIYGKTHEHHPSAVWVRENRGNYEWLWQLGQWLLEEYGHRYSKLHACRHVLRTLERAPTGLQPGEQNEPPPAMPEECVVSNDGYIDAVASYRHYYRTVKRPLLQYRRRAPPEWVRDVAQHNSLLTKHG
jgi:hypothetical protein